MVQEYASWLDTLGVGGAAGVQGMRMHFLATFQPADYPRWLMDRLRNRKQGPVEAAALLLLRCSRFM